MLAQLVPELIRFLRDPVIHLRYTPDDDLALLQMQVQDLQRQLDEANKLIEGYRSGWPDLLAKNERYKHLLRVNHISYK